MASDVLIATSSDIRHWKIKSGMLIVVVQSPIVPIHNCMGLSLIKTLDPVSAVTLFGLNPPSNSRNGNCEVLFADH